MGSSGGGSSSGEVDYPTYMKDCHNEALNDMDSDVTNSSMVDLVNVALATNPFNGLAAYDAGTDLDSIDTAVGYVESGRNSLTAIDWAAKLVEVRNLLDTELFDDATIAEAVSAFNDLLTDELEEKSYPLFEAGMRDINAVMSSSFVIGRGLIEARRIKEVAKYDAELRHKAYLQRNESVLSGIGDYLNWYGKVWDIARQTAALVGDTKKLRIVAEREYIDQEIKVSDTEARWEFEAFMYLGNFLAAIGGGTYVPFKQSSGSAIVSGMFSGAATGYQASGNGWGAAVGGIVGGIGGALS